MNHKIGIIGYGKMGQIRHNAINEMNSGDVVAISDPYIKAPINEIPNISVEELLNNSRIDIVIICTPNYLNKKFTIKALNANKHVFCEKPPCLTEGDMEEIIDVETKSGKKLMYGFNHRHHDSIIRMKEIINSGQFGKILWMRGRYGKSVTPEYFKEWRTKKDLAGGGILIDQGIHMLDLFIHFGGDFDTIKAEVTNSYWNSEVEDNAFVILKNSHSGLVASLHSTMTQWRHLFSLEVFLENGYMVLNGLLTSSNSYGDEVLSVARNRTTSPAATWKDEVKTQYIVNHSWRYEIESFFNSIDNDRPIEIGNSGDAITLMRIISKIYEQKDF
ncbi:MAG: Gfo/Idh/MocA family oxidoreductase [Planctomycetia bacterium]|nr:Gfo/Idh/MocA family oxidoreductase [Planctomycetia bacterium]